MKMKKVLAILMVGVMILGMTACGSDNKETTEPEVQTTDNKQEEKDNTEEDKQGAAEGTVILTGSTSVDSIVNGFKDEFEALNPKVTVQYTGSGSSAGMSDTKAGTNNIGALSREVKEDEKEEGLEEVVFAYDGIAVIVNPENGVENVTMEQLLSIYAGEIKNWSELGGEDKDIFVVSREESSGTRSAFEELIDLEDGELTGEASVVEGNGTVQSTVAGNENAIGYVSFSYVDDSIKTLTVEGIEPTPENAKSGDYELSRPFIFVYFEDQVTEAGKAFIDYALSVEGQDIVEENGGIAVK